MNGFGTIDRQSTRQRFELEALEARVLLSADGVSALAEPVSGNDSAGMFHHETLFETGSETESQEEVIAERDLFGGMEEVEVEVDGGAETSATDSPGEEATDTEIPHEDPTTIGNQSSVKKEDSISGPAEDPVSYPAPPGDVFEMTDELVDMQLASMPPPVYQESVSLGMESPMSTHIEWDGGGDGTSWLDPLNWGDNLLPENGDSVEIDNVSSGTVVMNSVVVDLLSLNVTGGFDLISSTLGVEASSKLNGATSFDISEVTVQEELIFNGPVTTTDTTLTGPGSVNFDNDVVFGGDFIDLQDVTVNLQGDTVMAADSQFRVGGGLHIEILQSGSFTVTGKAVAVHTGGDPVTVDNQGTLTMRGGQDFDLQTFTNQGGDVVVESGRIEATSYVQSNGSTEVQSGGGLVQASGSIEIQGGELRTAGPIDGSLWLSGGTFRPGFGATPGITSISGTYLQDAGGTLTLKAVGTQVSGISSDEAILDGNLQVEAPGAFTPGVGDRFTLVDVPTVNPVQGDFASVDLPSLGGSDFLTVDQSGGDLDLVVSTTFVWDAGGDGADFFDGDNWDLGSVPGTGDAVVVDLPGAKVGFFTTGSPHQIGSLTLGSDSVFSIQQGGLQLDGLADIDGELGLGEGALTGGTLDVSGTLVLDSGTVSFSQSTWSGTVNKSGTGTATIGGEILLTGDLDWNSGDLSGDNALWTIGSGGRVRIDNGRSLTGVIDIKNEGLIEKISGTGTTLLAAGGSLNNSGVIRVGSGSLFIGMDGSGDGEWRTTAAGTVLGFVGGTQLAKNGSLVNILEGSTLLIDGGNLDTSGRLFSFGTTDVRDGRLGFLGVEGDTNLDGTILLSGGQLGSTGDFRLNGDLAFTGGTLGAVGGLVHVSFGTVTLNAAAPVSVNGNVRVRGEWVWQGGDIKSDSLDLQVSNGGRVILEGSSDAVWSPVAGGFDIVNFGEITKRGSNTLTLGGATATFRNVLNRDWVIEEGVLEILGDVENQGDFDLRGTLRVDTLRHTRDTMIFSGTIDGNFEADANLQIGGTKAGVATYVTGDLTLTSRVEVDLFQDPDRLIYDRIIVTGAVVLGGTLRMYTHDDDAILEDGDIFDVVTGASVSGAFSFVSPLELDGGYKLIEAVGPDRYRLAVEAPVVWDGGGDGSSWIDPLNWDADIVPRAGSNVSILLPGADVRIDQPGLNPVVDDLFVGSDATLRVINESLTVEGQLELEGTLEVVGLLNLSQFGFHDGNLRLDGGTVDGGFGLRGVLSGQGTVTGYVSLFGPLRPDGTLTFEDGFEFYGSETLDAIELDITDSSTFDRLVIGGSFFGDGDVELQVPDPSALSNGDVLDIITVAGGFSDPSLIPSTGFVIDGDRFFTLDTTSHTDRITLVYTDTSTGGPDLPDSFFLDLGGLTLDSTDVTFFDTPVSGDPIGEINGISLTLPGFPDLSVPNPIDGFMIYDDRIEAEEIAFDLSGSFDSSLLSMDNLSATLNLELAYGIDAGEFSGLAASLLTLNWSADALTLYPDPALPGGGLISGSGFAGAFDVDGGTLSGTGDLSADFGNGLSLVGTLDLLLDSAAPEPESTIGTLRDLVLDLDLPAFPGTAEVDDLDLRRNGFELNGARFLGEGPLELGASPTLIRIFDPVLTVDAAVTADATVDVDVSARLSAVSAHLFPDLPDAPVTSDLFGIDGSFDIELGTYDLTVTRFAVSVNGVVDLSALAVAISYDPAVTDPAAVLGTATDVTVSFPQFPDLPTGTVDEVILRRDGFDINGATISAEEPDPGLGMTLFGMANFDSPPEAFVPDRPLIIVPGIGGTSPTAAFGQEAWLLERGLHPDGLEPDNLINAYHDILVTFDQAGYTLGTDLFFAAYDWRIAPGPRDGIIDGAINGFNADDITDDTFEYGVDYLGWFLKEAQDAFESEYGSRPGEVDVIAHSTGGLVTRSYIQSDAYEGEYGDLADGHTLPAFHNYIMVGVPNQGVSKSWNTLNDNWITDAANRMVVSKNLALAYYKVLAGKTISGPIYDITLADITVNGSPDPATFIDLYVPTIRDLLATYDFLIPTSGGEAADVNLDNQERNFLLLDLNAGLGLPEEIDDDGFVIRPDANAFVERVNGQVSVIAGGSVSTLEFAQEVEGGLSDLYYRFGVTGDIQGMTEWTARNPAVGERYWVDVYLENAGDGTVPLRSSVGQFYSDPNVDVHIFREGLVENLSGTHLVSTDEPNHVGLMSIEASQRLMQDLLGVNVDGSAPISTELAGRQYGNLITAIHDPIGGIIHNGDGTPIVGYDATTGTVIETPGARYFGGVDGISVITRDLEGAYFELTGVPGDGDYFVRVDAAGEGVTGGFEESGNLAPGETRTSEPFNIVNFFQNFGIEGMLELSQLSITLDLSVTFDTDGVDATGSISLAAAEAALLPDPETPELDGLVTATGITGGIDFETGVFSFAADTATLTVDGVLTASATGDGVDPGLFFSYNPDSTDPSEVMAELRSLTVTFDDLPDLGGDGLTLDLIQIRRDGLQLEATFGGPDSTFTFGNDPVWLSFDGLEITLNLDAARATNAAGLTRTQVSGFVDLSAAAAAILPGHSSFAASVQTLSGQVEFGPGVDPNLELTAAGFVAELSTLLHMEGTDVAFDLAGEELLTLSTLTVTSPDFPELAAATLDELIITRDGFSIDNLTLGEPDGVTGRLDNLLGLEGFKLSLDSLAFDAAAGTDPWSGTLGLEAESATLNPDANDGNGWASLAGLLGSFDLNTGDFDLGIDTLTVDMAGVLTLTTTGIVLTYNLDAADDDDLLRLLNAQAILSAIEVDGEFATVTFSEFGFQQDGDFFLGGALLELPEGFNSRLGLGGILPVELRSIAIDFTDPQDFNAFDLDVTVGVVLDASDWGFTPVLEINGANLIDGDELTVELSVASLRDGQIRLVGFGPTTLGFSDLVIGTHTFSGEIRFGEITPEGDLLPLPGESVNVFGTATVESSDNAELLDVTVNLEGTLTFTDTGATLGLLGEISASSDGGALSGDATFRFRLTITGEQPAAGGFILTVTPSFDSLVIENLVIVIENVLRITVERIEVLSTPVAVPELGDTQNALLINGTVELLMFPDWDVTATIGEIRQLNGPDGASGGVDRLFLDDIRLAVTGGVPDVIDFTNLELLFTELDLLVNSDDFSLVSISGGILGVSAEAATLFPGESGTFTTSVTDGDDVDDHALTGSFDLNTGDLALSLDQFMLDVPDLLTVTATGVSLALSRDEYGPDAVDPDPAGVIATVDSATVTFLAVTDDLGDPLVLDLQPQDAVPAMTLRRNGFDVASATFGPIDATLDGIARVEDLAILIENLGYTSGASPPLTGSITFTASAASLFEGSGVATVSATGITGFIHLGPATAELEQNEVRFSADSVTVDIIDVLVLEATTVTFTPAQPVLATFDSVNIELPGIGTFDGAELQGVVITRTGVEIDSASFTIAGPIDAGFLTLTGLTVTVTDFVADRDAGLSGDLRVDIQQAEFFPDIDAFSLVALSSGATPAISGQLSQGSLVFTAAELSGDVGGVFLFTISGLEIGLGPNDDPLFLAASVSGTIPALENLVVTLNALELTRAGDLYLNSISVESDGLVRSLKLGEFLPFDLSEIVITFAGDTNDNGVRDDGELWRLNEFSVQVTGSFNQEFLDSFPFTPILTIGGDAGDNGSFSFEIGFEGGSVHILDFGPITLGFSDLVIGPVTLGGSVTLGGYTSDGGFDLSEFGGTLSILAGFTNASGGLEVDFTGSFDPDLGILDLSATFNISFTLNDTIVLEDLALNFQMRLSTEIDGGLSVDLLQLEGVDVGRVEIRFGDFMIFEATGVSINFNPGPDEYFAVFASLTVNFPGLNGLGGGAGNFAIDADLKFVTLPDFFVNIDPGSNSFGFPDWFPVNISNIFVIWADLANDPGNFRLRFDVAVAESFPLPVVGGATGLEIDIGLLREGKFPITNLDTFSLGLEDFALGPVTISAVLTLGTVKLDADGNVLRGADALNDDLVEEKVFYGIVEGGVLFANTFGGNIIMGLSEAGPVLMYFEVNAPIILVPQIGLQLSSLRGGIRFGAEFPSVRDAEGNVDPLLLRDPAFQPIGSQTFEEIRIGIENQIAVIRQNAGGDEASPFDFLDAPVIVDMGASLTTTVIPGLFADVDILVSSQGAMLISGNISLQFPGMSSPFVLANTKLFVDLSNASADDVNADIVFLADLPEDPAVVTLRGFLSIQTLDENDDGENDAFKIIVGGGMDLRLGITTLVVDGEFAITFREGQTEISLFGLIELQPIGRMEIDGLFYITNGVGAWGALTLGISLGDGLEALGLIFDVDATLQFNTSGEEQTVEIPLQDGSGFNSITIEENSFAIFATGLLRVANPGDLSQILLVIDGSFILELNNDGFVMLADGTLIVGDVQPGQDPLLELNVFGILVINDLGLAAQLEVSLATNFPDSVGIAIGGQLTFLVNNAGVNITYDLPAGRELSDGTAQVTISGTVPGGTPGPYAYLDILGFVQILGFRIDGTAGLVVADGVFSLDVKGQMAVTGLGALSVSSIFEVSRAGVVASFAVGLQGGDGDSLQGVGFEFSGLYHFAFNTTGAARTLQVPAFDSVTGESRPGFAPVEFAARSARLLLYGSLGISDDGNEGMNIEGFFLISLSGRNFQATAIASLRFLGMDFHFNGLLEVITTGPLNQRGVIAEFDLGFSIQNSPAGFELKGTFGLSINTTGQNPGGLPSARLFANGTLVFLAGADDSFRIVGDVGFGFLGGNIRMFLSGEVDLGFLGNIAFSGNIQVGINGIAGTLALNAATSLSGTRFNISGRAFLEINTTGQSVELTRVRFSPDTGNPIGGTETVNLAARGLRIFIGGQLSFTDGFGVNGSFALRVSGNGFSLRVNGKVQVPLFPDLSVVATLDIRPAGMVGSLQVLLGNNFDNSDSRVKFTGFATLEINTTNSTQSVERLTDVFLVFPVTQSVSLAPGTVRLAIVGSLVLAESGSGARNFVIGGIGARFLLEVSGSSLLIGISGELQFGNLANLSVDASLTLNSSGIVGSLIVGGNGGINSPLDDVYIDGEVRFEINTTGSTASLFRPRYNDQGQRIFGLDTVFIQARTLRLFVGGELRATSLMKVQGRFEINVTSNGFSLDLDGTIQVLGSRFRVEGSGGIYTGSNPGIAFRVNLRLNGGLRPTLGFSGFSMAARFELQFNTRNTASNGVSANTLRIALTDVDLTLLTFSISGSASITASNTYFEVSGNLRVTLWEFATVDVGGEFRYYVSNNTTSMSFSASAEFNTHTPFITGGLRGTVTAYFTKFRYGSVSFGGGFLGKSAFPSPTFSCLSAGPRFPAPEGSPQPLAP